MKEIGLLFTPENRDLVRRNLKTQTRRGNGLETINAVASQIVNNHQVGPWWHFEDEPVPVPGTTNTSGKMWTLKCPYGNPQEDQISYYLKEPVQVLRIDDSNLKSITADIRYPDTDAGDRFTTVQITPGDYHKLVSRQDWRKASSSMFMLRSFARTWLPGVRTWPERLGDMSAEDAITEGCEIDPQMVPFGRRNDFIQDPCWRDYLNGGYDLTPVQSYASLWNSINGKTHPWAPDLWTWAVEWTPPATGNPG